MKTNLDRAYKINSNMAQDGIIYAVNDVTSFRVRYMGAQNNPRAKAAFAKHYKPYAHQVERGTLEPEKNLEIQMKLFIDLALVSWEGVEVDDKPLEFTPENALMLFKGLPDLFDSLWKYSNDFQNYREDLGNS